MRRLGQDGERRVAVVSYVELCVIVLRLSDHCTVDDPNDKKFCHCTLHNDRATRNVSYFMRSFVTYGSYKGLIRKSDLQGHSRVQSVAEIGADMHLM